MKLIVSKYFIFLEEEFILREDSGNKVDVEEIQKTTNEIDQLDEPTAKPASDEAHIDNGKLEVPDDMSALEKSNRVIRHLRRHDLLITNDEFLIEKDEPTI
ncbi:hypothetical protein Adt_41994 [Abeliophyllum distichum]|uniref:Uncharacterized protein n=1 Tax=Abeliophyllum distichum TaxID=126358 RepID=A0ABD1PQF2_9LAMI